MAGNGFRYLRTYGYIDGYKVYDIYISQISRFPSHDNQVMRL